MVVSTGGLDCCMRDTRARHLRFESVRVLFYAVSVVETRATQKSGPDSDGRQTSVSQRSTAKDFPADAKAT